MKQQRPINLSIIGLVVAWQVIVIGLSAAGIFVSIFGMLGIPWNSTGLENVVGTVTGLIILELPVAILVTFLMWRRRRET
jgi:hypothetical protein